jgi:hypothetical protein
MSQPSVSSGDMEDLPRETRINGSMGRLPSSHRRQSESLVNLHLNPNQLEWSMIENVDKSLFSKALLTATKINLLSCEH